eukprot:995602-Rhodomonas_salina.2
MPVQTTNAVRRQSGSADTENSKSKLSLQPVVKHFPSAKCTDGSRVSRVGMRVVLCFAQQSVCVSRNRVCVVSQCARASTGFDARGADLVDFCERGLVRAAEEDPVEQHHHLPSPRDPSTTSRDPPTIPRDPLPIPRDPSNHST